MQRWLSRIGQAAALALTTLAWCCAPASANPLPSPSSPSSPPAVGGVIAPRPPPPLAPLPSAMVRIAPADPRIALERRAGSIEVNPVPRSMYADLDPRWERVCFAPCQALLPIGGEYRIAGQDITPSSTFSLRGPSLDLSVKTGSASARTTGSYLALFGFLVGAVGGVMATIAGFSKTASAGNHASLIAGAVGAGVGGGVGIVGLGIALGSGTSVSDGSGGGLPEYVGPFALLHAPLRF